jgi:2-phosphosulfolactate phosphatase
MDIDQKKIEVCFTPAIFNSFQDPKAIVVVVDVLRATSAICTAFMNGVQKIIPIGTVEEARDLKNRGYLVAAERDGFILDFADFGNSPFNFTVERVKGKTIVYSTTNGTQAINLANSCYKVTVGSFLNITALSRWLIQQQRNVIIFCAGWKNRFSLEDAVLAGALTEKLLTNPNFFTECDSALASLDLWSIAKKDLMGYVHKTAQRSRLQKNGLDDVIQFCHTPDQTNIIPIYSNGFLTGITEQTSVLLGNC